MKVIVVPDIEPGEVYLETSFIRVHTYPMPEDCSVRMAVVEHHYASLDQRDSSKRVRCCLTLIDHERMSHESAMEMAMQYAQQTDVPLIYERNEVAETDADGTVVLRKFEPSR